MELSDSWPMSGRIRATGYAWAWPFIVAAFANADTDWLEGADLTDGFLRDMAQLDCDDAIGRSTDIINAFCDMGLLECHGYATFTLAVVT